MSGVLWASPKATKIAGFKVQTSVYGLPIPIVYGTTRIAGNLIHMPNPPHIVPSQGKGITSKGSQSGQNYNAAMIVALCEGPIDLGNVWRDKDTKVAFSVYAAAGFGLAIGSTGQTGWASLPSAQRLAYRQVAYVDHPSWPLPNDAMSSYSWEVKGFQIFGGAVVDASPADVISDYLTNARYGVGFPPAQLGSFTTFQDYCAAFSLFCSPAFTSQQSARDQLNELLEISNTGAVWSDGVLKFKPYGDVAATANGHTYTPNTTPVYDLTDNDYLSRGEGVDPIIVKRKSPIECFNQITVQYDDRSFDYNQSSQKAEDQFSLLTYGPRPMPPMELSAIKSAAVAQQVAQIRLQREQNVRNTYLFKLGWRFALLEPMDLVTLTDSGLGLSLTPVRITQIVELDNEDGYEVTAEDWPFGTASATLYTTASNSGTSTDTNVDPGNTSTPTLLDGPAALLTSPYELWIAASGGTYWGGCDVWISTDNANFTKVGSIIGKASYGSLTAGFGTDSRYPAIDTTHTVSVDLTASNGDLSILSNAQFLSLATPMWVNGEWMAYRDATLTSANHYNLTHLYRGLFMSTIAAHSNGDPFVFCDEHVARIPWPSAVTGQTLYVKLPAFNIYGGALQDVGSVASTSHVIGSDALPRFSSMPQGTVSIDTNGLWSATADGPSSTNSYKYLASTSGYPSDASVIAGGTVVNGRSFSVVSGGTLAFGETIYITIVPYSYESGNGVALQAIHIRGSYQSYTATKTSFWPATAFAETTLSKIGFTIDANGNLVNGPDPAGTSPGTEQYYGESVAMPDGVTITNVALDVYNVGGLGAPASLNLEVGRLEAGVKTGLGSDSTATTAAWVTLNVVLSESVTSGRSYEFTFHVHFAGTIVSNRALAGTLGVTYTMPTPEKTI